MGFWTRRWLAWLLLLLSVLAIVLGAATSSLGWFVIAAVCLVGSFWPLWRARKVDGGWPPSE